MERAELQRRVDAIGWYHSIDLGHGVVTPGAVRVAIPEHARPDFSGRTVLDIGAWDGYYSFLAERAGATRVVALDHYMWRLDFVARQAYWEECAREGCIPDPQRDATFLRDDLPGRQGFDLAKEALTSRVEPVVDDFMHMDLATLGSFDVVLMLGVLYHLPEPFTAVQRLRRLTREVAVIETEAIQVSGHEHEPLCTFFAGNELNEDHTNWMALSEAALHGMCRAAGFRRVVTKVGPHPPSRVIRARRGVRDVAGRAVNRQRTRGYRIVVQAFVDP